MPAGALLALPTTLRRAPLACAGNSGRASSPSKSSGAEDRAAPRGLSHTVVRFRRSGPRRHCREQQSSAQVLSNAEQIYTWAAGETRQHSSEELASKLASELANNAPPRTGMTVPSSTASDSTMWTERVEKACAEAADIQIQHSHSSPSSELLGGLPAKLAFAGIDIEVATDLDGIAYERDDDDDAGFYYKPGSVVVEDFEEEDDDDGEEDGRGLLRADADEELEDLSSILEESILVDNPVYRLSDSPSLSYLIQEIDATYQRGSCGGSRVIRAHMSRVHSRLRRLFASDPAVDTKDYTAKTIPVTAHFPRAISSGFQGCTAPLLHALSQISGDLEWRYDYTQYRSGRNALHNKMGWTELVGPKGMVKSNQIVVGFVLLAPNTTYPTHVHKDISESYVSLSGCWSENDTGVYMPGSLVFNPPGMPHKITTGTKDPCLLAYVWEGEPDALGLPQTSFCKPLPKTHRRTHQGVRPRGLHDAEDNHRAQ